jgi:tetratricopeptide (TPR) repeat protein
MMEQIDIIILYAGTRACPPLAIDLPLAAHNTVHFKLGCVYKEIEKYETAVTCFTKVLEINPSLKATYSMRSETFELMGNYRAALWI